LWIFTFSSAVVHIAARTRRTTDAFSSGVASPFVVYELVEGVRAAVAEREP
jgi:hypothetical protein